MSDTRNLGERFPDPALIDRPIGEPVNPWPLLHRAMCDWRGLAVLGVVMALAVLS